MAMALAPWLNWLKVLLEEAKLLIAVRCAPASAKGKAMRFLARD